MAQHDYVKRKNTSTRKKNNKKNQPKNRIKPFITIAVVVVIICIVFVGVLSHQHRKEQQAKLVVVDNKKSELPPKPKERWRYFNELINPSVDGKKGAVQSPSKVNTESSATSLTNEQKELLAQIQSDMKKSPATLVEVPYNGKVDPSKKNVILSSPDSVTVKNTAPKEPSPSEDKNISLIKEKKLTLQCGAFRNKEQADTIRAQLAFAGIESDVNYQNGWYKVALGSYKTQQEIDTMMQRLRQAGVPNCIASKVGG